MDDRRFDSFVRLVGRGASRRTILKGLLGLGGSAAIGGAILSDSDARTVSTIRPTIPPPPSPTPKPVVTPTTTPTPTPDPCLGFRCGLDCCADELQCCDGECCPADTVCLTRVFPEGPFVEEETCCPAEHTCDNQCCDGACISLTGAETGIDRECCPAGGTICTNATPGALCCSGDTPQCCVTSGTDKSCIAAGACCEDDDCPNDPANCLTGICNDGVCGTQHTCPSARCCGDFFCCAAGLECCPGTVDGLPGFTCFNPATHCCSDEDCPVCQACSGGRCQPVESESNCATGCCNGVCCPAGQSCISNVCRAPCLPVQSVCDAFAPTCCQDVPTTCSFDANCTTTQGEARCCRPIGGACTARCDCCENADCVDGTCQLGSGQQCADAGECAGADPACCDGTCRDLDSDVHNCGGCGLVCQSATNPGEVNTCIQGSCGVACAGGYTLCGVFCVLTGSDENNCGTCGNVCPSGQTCCFGTCRDLNTDENSCGECGALCPGTCCNGECEDLLLDELNCGACGHNCFFELCGGSTSCPDLVVNCCEGACVDLATDNSNCGECGTYCPLGRNCTGAICLTI